MYASIEGFGMTSDAKASLILRCSLMQPLLFADVIKTKILGAGQGLAHLLLGHLNRRLTGELLGKSQVTSDIR